jgi:hypothetical protein
MLNTAAATAEPTPPQRPELAPEDVLFGLQSELETLRACLPEAGSLQLRWSVAKSGDSRDFAVNWTTLSEAATSRAVDSCLGPRIQQRHFEVPNGTSVATATWTFVKKLPLERGNRRVKAAKRRGQGVQVDPPGSLHSDEVDAIVQSGMKLYAHCLRSGIEKQSDLHGKLTLSWQVDAQGNASSMFDAGSDLSSQTVIDCAAECFYALRFPEPASQPVKVTYSLLLNED